MSTVLAIETSTSHGSVALAAGGRLIAREEFASERSHNAEIFAPLQRLWSQLNGNAPDAIVVGTGPGSYTGVRIGISCGIGLSLARAALLIGVPSVCGVECDSGSYTIVGDARRGLFWHCAVVDGIVVRAPSVVAVEELHGAISDASHVFTFDERMPVASAPLVTPSAGVHAIRFSRESEAALKEKAPPCVEPIYLAAPFVTAPKARQRPR